MGELEVNLARGHVLKGCAALCIIIPATVFCCLAIYVAALVRAVTPFRKVRDSLTGFMDGVVSVWIGINAWMLGILGLIEIETSIEGPLSDREHWWVVVSNHQSWSDVIAIQCALLRLAPTIKFVTKRELIWVPFVGLAMWLLRFPYVRRFSAEAARRDQSLIEKNRQAMERAAKQFLQRPISVLTFLEGTRFTQAKHREQDSPFEHLLNPRTGGLAFVLDALGPRATRIVDLTLNYEGAVPGFWELLCGRCRRVTIAIRCIEITDEFKSELKTSVFELWQQKDVEIARVRSRSQTD